MTEPASAASSPERARMASTLTSSSWLWAAENSAIAADRAAGSLLSMTSAPQTWQTRYEVTSPFCPFRAPDKPG